MTLEFLQQLNNVTKRDGSIVAFNEIKIIDAVSKAFKSTGITFTTQIKNKLMDSIIEVLNIDPRNHNNSAENNVVDIETIQDAVEIALIKEGYITVAKEFMKFRGEKTEIRNQKKKLLGVEELSDVEKKYSYDALRIFKERYLLKDNEGNTCERLDDLFKRVAVASGIMEVLYDERFYNKNGKSYNSSNYQDRLEIYQKYNSQLDYKDILNNKYNIKIKDFTVNLFHQERLLSRYIELQNENKMKVSYERIEEALTNDKELQEKYLSNIQKYYDLMANRFFLPNTPTLMNSGTKLSQGAACFVLEVKDSIESIGDLYKELMIISKSGGGVGCNYSNLRPEGSLVKSTGGISSGVISFMSIVDKITDVVKQGGKRKGANMGLLNLSHPEILKFIKVKNNITKEFENFNISTVVNDNFFECFFLNKNYDLVFDGRLYNSVNSKNMMDMIITNVYETADPGMVFVDNMNKNNLLIDVFGHPINSCNPCQEENLYENESCNLASINLTKFIEENGKFNISLFKEVCSYVTQFLDGIIDSNKYPTEKINETSKNCRRIGLGYMGLGDILTQLNIPYNSEKGMVMIEYLSALMTGSSITTSCHIAELKGSFPLYYTEEYEPNRNKLPVNGYLDRNVMTSLQSKLSILNDCVTELENIENYYNTIPINLGLRNCNHTCIAPTGTLSMFTNVSSGIEPVFSHGFTKKVTIGEFNYVNSNLESRLKGLDIYSDKLIEKIVKHNGGKLSGIDEIPQEIKDVFVTSMEIHPFDHITAQSVAQRWITNSISKTINAPNDIPAKDIEYCYVLAWAMGSKGTTVYRDGSKHEQVLNNSSTEVQIPFGDLKVSDYTLDQIKTNERLPEEYKEQLLGSCNVTITPSLKTIVDGFHMDIRTVKEVKIECPKCHSLNSIASNGSRCQLCMSCGYGIGSCE